MACNQTLSGLARDCSPNMGGIVEVYLANQEDISGVTISDGIISTITMVTSKKFKKYQFSRNSGSMSSTYTIDNAAGTKFVSTDLVLQFNRMDTAKRVEISALAINDLVAIVKDANGKFWYLGYDNAVNASAGDGQTGTAMGDANRYTITLQDNSHEMPYEVTASIVDALVD